MIFSTDTVVLISCDTYPKSIDTVLIYNNTDEDIIVNWELTQYQSPHESYYWLIFEPLQYPPSIPHGHVRLDARDTAWIIFYLAHDNFYPGDSAWMQIKVYDPLDSFDTSQTLTAIQYCPIETSITETPEKMRLQVFPNPVVDEVTIKIPEQITATDLNLYCITGELVRQWPLIDHEITVPRDGLPGGMYFVGVESQGQVLGITKIVLVE